MLYFDEKKKKKIALTNSNFFREKGLSSNINKTGGSAIVYNGADMSRHRDTQLENPIKG